jgi:hypothetical protein
MGREILEKGLLCGERRDEQVIQRSVKNQGRKAEEYQKIYEGKQLELFPYQNKA